jgi:endonuclease-3
MDELVKLPGVGRKTANVVLGNAYGMNLGFVVDTHIERLSKRFALVQWTDPVKKIEQRLMALFPRERWRDLSHMIISHGRQVCRARLPAGTKCQDNAICAEFGIACECRAAKKPPR